MMHSVYGGMSAGGWVLMSVFWIGLLALIVWLVATLWSRGAGEDRGLAERPEDILDRRFASGDIDAATYDGLSAKLRDVRAARG